MGAIATINSHLTASVFIPIPHIAALQVTTYLGVQQRAFQDSVIYQFTKQLPGGLVGASHLPFCETSVPFALSVGMKAA